MAFVTLTSACVLCGHTFTYNPVRVPSVRVRGQREPICRPCVEWANDIRAARGLATWPVAADAYDAVDESEVVWPDD